MILEWQQRKRIVRTLRERGPGRYQDVNPAAAINGVTRDHR